MPVRYSKDELLQELRECKRREGKCSPSDLRKHDDLASPSTVARHFESWSEAKDQAGIEEDLSSETGRKQDYADAQILSHLKECQRREGKVTTETLSDHDDLVSPTTVVERFGSWLEAKKEAGVGDERKTNSRPSEYTDEAYLEMLQECEQKHGRVTQRVFNADDEFASAGAVRDRFGSWSNAKDQADIESSQARYTDAELLEMLRTCKQRHGNCTANTFAEDNEFCAPETLQRRFGSWSAAKELIDAE